MADEIKKRKDIWEILEILSKFTTGFLLVVIAFVLDIGSKRIAQSNEESKIIQSLIEDLTTKQAESRNDVALLSLEKYLLAKEGKEPAASDKAYIIEVAETILQQRIHEDAALSLESSIPYRILNKYDPAKATDVFAQYSENKRDTSRQQKEPVTTQGLDTSKPIVQSKTVTEANVISSFNKKLCYIQYNNKQNIDAVKIFQNALKSKSWVAPGIDYVEGNYNNTIKYFNDEDKPLADRAADIGKQIFNNNFKIVSITSSKYKVPRGQIEVWVNNK